MLFDPQSAKFYVLNGTMAYLWRNWSETTSIDDLATAFGREFAGVECAVLASDLQSAVDELKSLGLLLD